MLEQQLLETNSRHNPGSMDRESSNVSYVRFDEPPPDGVEPGVAGVVKNQMGTYLGVFQPCVLNIFGAIVFFRLTWCVGQAGWLGSLLEFGLAAFAVLLTVFSLAAISTNGTMGSGGSYNMISRSLGPELGGAVGVLFYISQAVSVTFYVIAFSEEVYVSFLEGHIEHHRALLIIGSLVNLILLVIGFCGAGFFLRLNTPIFAILMFSMFCAALGFLFGGSEADATEGYVGPSMELFLNNTWFDFTVNDQGDPVNFPKVFMIILPALLGVQAGANMSGDLKDPGKSIGKGTLIAVGYSMSIYVTLICLSAASVERTALREHESMMQHITFSPYIIIAGVFASTISSAIGSFVGSARILQALSRDDLIPGLGVFAFGSKKGDEPLIAILMTWLIAQGCLLIGSLDYVASIISGLSLLVYAFVNFSCFVLRITSAPNFRPLFKFFSWHTALAGTIVCLIIMFLGSTVYALLSIVLVILLSLFVHYRAPVVPWGDVTQAIMYHQVRKYLLRLDERKSHPKFWRPSIMLLTNNPRKSLQLIDFCNNLKKSGLYILGSCVLGSVESGGSALKSLRQHWTTFADQAKVKAFGEVSLAHTLGIGWRSLFTSVGIGGMRPNTVALQLEEVLLDDVGERWRLERADVLSEEPGSDLPVEEEEEELGDGRGGSSLSIIPKRFHNCMHTVAQIERLLGTDAVVAETAIELTQLIRDVLFFDKNVLVTRNFHLLDKELMVAFEQSTPASQKTYVDIWTFGLIHDSDFQGELSLSLQLAHVLHRTDIWAECTQLRLVCVIPPDADMDLTRKEVTALLYTCRIQAQLFLLTAEEGTPLLAGQRHLPQSEWIDSMKKWNSVLLQHTSQTGVMFIAVPQIPPSDAEGSRIHVRGLLELTQQLPPCMLVTSGRDIPIIATEI